MKQARGEARQSGGATSAASPNLGQGEDTVEELEPCPFCAIAVEQRNGGIFHPEGDGECLLADLSWSASYYVKQWNTRPQSITVTELAEAARPFAESVVIDPDKKRGERHWAICGKLTNLDDVLRLQAALSKVSPLGR